MTIKKESANGATGMAWIGKAMNAKGARGTATTTQRTWQDLMVRISSGEARHYYRFTGCIWACKPCSRPVVVASRDKLNRNGFNFYERRVEWIRPEGKRQMTEKPNTDMWQQTGMTTTKIREVGKLLQENISNLTVAGSQKSAKDQMLTKALTHLMLAADRIDRLEQETPRPHIVSITTHVDANEMFLFGVDSVGHVYQYQFSVAAPGWVAMHSGAIEIFEDAAEREQE